MHGIALTTNFVTASGVPVLVYNLASYLFFILFAASCYAFGALAVPTKGINSNTDILLLRSITGYSLFSFLGYAIGLAGLLTNPIAIGALAMPLLLFPKDSLCIPPLSRNDKLKLALLVVAPIYLFCFSGISSLYIENDFAQYYPAYELALKHGDLWPDIFFWTSFFTRGCGAAYLAMAATSKFSIQIASFYAVTFMCLLTYRMCAMMTGNQIVAVATALLVLATKMLKLEFYRGHALFSLMLLSIPYLMARQHLGPDKLRTRLRFLLAFWLCTTILLQPSTAAFLVLPLIYLMVAAWFDNSLASPRVALSIAATPALIFLAIIFLNYFTTGIPELTPLHTMQRYIDYAKVSEWINPHIVQASIASEHTSTIFSIRPDKIYTLIINVCIASLSLLLLYVRPLRRKPQLMKRLQIVFVPILTLGIACPLIAVFSKQASFSRYIVFYSAIQPLYVATFLLITVNALVPWLQQRFPALWPPRKILTVLFSVIACYAVLFNWTPKLQHQIAHARAFFGLTSMRPLLANWHEPELDLVNETLPETALVLPLYPSYYGTLLNSTKFLRPLENQHIRNFPVLLGADADAAAQEYLHQGMRYFVVDLDPAVQMVYEVYAELFTAESVSRHFRIRFLGKQKWLLTLSGTDADGSVPDETFLHDYALKRYNEIRRPNNDWYPIVRELRERFPEFALPIGQ